MKRASVPRIARWWPPRPSAASSLGVALVVLLLLPACRSGNVHHPLDVQLLVAASRQADADGFRLIGPDEQVDVKVAPPEPYKIGVSDVVYVSVPGQAQFVGFGETAQGDIVGTRVKEDGNLYLPLIRTVPATGRTVVELQDDIRQKLVPYVDDPFVSVDIVEYESQKFYVLGEVPTPGAYEVNGRTSLIEAVAAAGGLGDEDADVEGAYVIRDGEVLPISLADVVRRGDASGNLVMRDKDLVFVPHRKDRKVYVLGEVVSPGIVPMDRDGKLTLAEAIAAAEGLDPKTAAEDQIRIFRGGWRCPKAYTLSSCEIYKYGETILLQPGDRILVAPTGLATWSRALDQVSPFVSATATALGLAGTVKILSE